MNGLYFDPISGDLGESSPPELFGNGAACGPFAKLVNVWKSDKGPAPGLCWTIDLPPGEDPPDDGGNWEVILKKTCEANALVGVKQVQRCDDKNGPPPGMQGPLGQDEPVPGQSCEHPLFVEICAPIPPIHVFEDKDKPVQPTEEIQPVTPSSFGLGPGLALPIGAGPVTCDQIENFARQYIGVTGADVLSTAGITAESGQFGWVETIIENVNEIPVVGELLGVMVAAAGSLLVAPITAWITVQSYISSTVCENPGAVAQIANMRGPLTWMKRLLGIETRQVDTVLDHWENYICPVNVPSAAEANLARRTGDISPEEWRCWVRLNGFNETVQERVYNSFRLQLTPDQIIRLWRRKELNDQEAEQWLYRAGMISTQDQIALAAVTQFIPPVSDLLHFIVRGIGDPEIVQRFKLLEEFDTLYQGQLIDWGEANAITKETMEAYHAAHWVVPSPGQLFTMLQRLRPDNVPPGVDANDWSVTHDDLDRALRENAFAPFWRPRMEAISYVPLGIRQIKKAFTEGAMQADVLLDRLRDLGYSGFTAVEYQSVLELERRDFMRRHDVTKLYIESAINYNSAGLRLQQEGYQEEEVRDVLEWAKTEALDKSRLECVKGIKRQFEGGGIDANELQAELSELELDPEQITRLRVTWECEKKKTGKQIAASQLCQWADLGLITPQEYLDRLKNVGYDDADAERIVAECNIKLSSKQLAARERALKQALAELQKSSNRQDVVQRRKIAEARREANLISRLQREAASAEARAERKAQQVADRATRSVATAKRIARSQVGKIRATEARIARATELWAELGKLDPLDAAREVTRALETVSSQEGRSADIAIRAVLQAILRAKKVPVADLAREAQDQADVLLGYAEIATSALCEPSNGACPSPENNGGT